MATTLALAMRASMSAGGVVSGANEAARALDRMGEQAQRTARDVSTLKNISIGSVVAKGISGIGNAFLSVGQSALSYVSGVANAVNATSDLAKQAGISAEAVQVLQMAGVMNGVNDATGAVKRLSAAIAQAGESGRTDAFAKLGVDFTALRGLSPEKQFMAIQEAISALPTEAERAAAAVSLFGKAGVELLPLMNENLGTLEQRMRRLGAVVSEDQVAAVSEMYETFSLVKATIDGIIGQVQGNLAPIVTQIANTFLEFVEGYKGVSGDGGSGVANAMTEGLMNVIQALARVVDQAIAGFNQLRENFKITPGNVASAVAQRAPVVVLGKMALKGAGMAASSAGLIESDQGGEQQAQAGSLESAVIDTRKAAEQANTPEAKEQRKAAQEQRDAERKLNADKLAAAEQAKQAQEQAAEEARKVIEQTRTAEEQHASEMARLRDLKEQNLIDEETFIRAAAEADEKLRDYKEQVLRKEEQAAEAAARQAEQQSAAVARQHESAVSQAKATAEQIVDKIKQIQEIRAEKRRALEGKSDEVLKANDIRSSEGMAQFLALATGREDPAIAENRKTNQKLDELKAEIGKLAGAPVDIIGAAA